MDANLAASVAATDYVQVLQPSGVALATVAQITADPLAQISALQAALAALVARVSALEGRPEEVAHFTAFAPLPTLAAAASMTLRLTGLVPARAGDAVKAGETVSAEPAAALPAGLNIAAVSAPQDGVVAVQLTASVAVAGSSAPIAWNVTALR